MTGSDHYARRAQEIGEFLMAEMYQRRSAHAQLAGRPGPPSGRGRRSRLADRGLRPPLRADRGRDRGGPGPSEVADELLQLDSGTSERGGFFTTGDDAEALVVRPKEFIDGALPAANSIATWALLRAGRAQRRRPPSGGRSTARWRWPSPAHHASGRAGRPGDALPMVTERQEIVVTGDRPDLLDEVRRHWLPSASAGLG